MKLIQRIALGVALLTLLPHSLSAQELHYNIDFETYFDNREYHPIAWQRERSGTDFAARIAPALELHFANDHKLNFGVEAIAPFTVDGERLFEESELMLYYGYDSPHWSVSAGKFPRERMAIESYSTAFFRDDYLFYDNMVNGVMGQYRLGESFVEMVVDWESQPTTESREIFRLLSAGRRTWRYGYVGYNASLTHFAGQRAEWLGGVVDNGLFNPYVGARYRGAFEVEGRVGYLLSLQRDRSYGNAWMTPGMTELGVRLSRWGFTLDEALYLGDNLFPLFEGQVAEDGTAITYGEQLYTGDQLYRTQGGFYNRATVGYARNFLRDRLTLRVEFITHCTAEGLGTEQRLKLQLNLGGKLCSLKR